MFSLFKRFKEGLKRTANGALGKLAGLFSKKIDPSDIALIEETLIEADFGYETVCEIIDAIKSEYKRDSQLQGRRAAEIGAEVLARILEGLDGSLAKSADSNPSVVCLVGKFEHTRRLYSHIGRQDGCDLWGRNCFGHNIC